jgi:hypothetical protein
MSHHGEGIHVQRQPTAGQQPIVGTRAGQQRLDEHGHVVEQIARSRIHALAQCRAGGQKLDVQRLLEEGVATKVLDRVKVGLALHQQTQVAAQDVAVGNAIGYRQRRIDALEGRCELVQIMADKGEPRYRGEVIVELLDEQWAHGEGS